MTHQNKETSPTRFTEAMVEIVARAIWALNEDTDCADYDQLARFAKDRADEMARAALTALTDSGSVILPREATEAPYRVTEGDEKGLWKITGPTICMWAWCNESIAQRWANELNKAHAAGGPA